MGLFKKLSNAFQAAASGAVADDRVMWLYVQCDYCGEVVRVRVNKSTDLEHLYDEGSDAAVGYALHKEVIGSDCYRLMRVEMKFDSSHRVLDQSVRGGRLVSREEAEAAKTHNAPPSAFPS